MGKSVPGRIKLSVTCKPVIGVEADCLGRGTGDREFAGTPVSPLCLHLLVSLFNI